MILFRFQIITASSERSLRLVVIYCYSKYYSIVLNKGCILSKLVFIKRKQQQEILPCVKTRPGLFTIKCSQAQKMERKTDVNLRIINEMTSLSFLSFKIFSWCPSWHKTIIVVRDELVSDNSLT